MSLSSAQATAAAHVDATRAALSEGCADASAGAVTSATKAAKTVDPYRLCILHLVMTAA